MSALFTPFKLGSTTIPNRIGMSALLEIARRKPSQRDHGVLVTRQGSEWPEAPGLWDKSQVAGWKKITDAVHETGSKMYAQIWHLGRISHPDAPSRLKPAWYASLTFLSGLRTICHLRPRRKVPLLPGSPGYVTPTEIDDPTVLIAQYKQAAINAKEAGFDGVERTPIAWCQRISGPPVLGLYFQPPHRQVGGSPENRARFALEILKELVDVWGPDVALKISPAGGYNDMGMPLQDTIDTFGYLLREVNKLGLSYVVLMRYSPYLDLEFDGKKRATQHDVVETFRPFLTNTPVFVNAGVTPAEAEELVESGKAAGVFMGLNWISHPDLGRRIKEGKQLDNAPDFAHLYGAEGVDPALGYVDYKEATY
ncbi:flavoprotein NADH-dependent oxidoreductase [Mycena leptocephala]|nr:flavoprotein NADH-dependent oxidoreductase [Mycena leptocephala]